MKKMGAGTVLLGLCCAAALTLLGADQQAKPGTMQEEIERQIDALEVENAQLAAEDVRAEERVENFK